MAGPEREGVEPSGTLEVQGEASWADGLAADVGLTLDRFPWYSLVPGLDEPPVSLNRLEGRASYQEDRYQADLDAQVAGPLGDAELQARLDGDNEAVRITQLDMTTGAGSLSGEAELDFSSQLAWQAALVLDQFNPGYWVPVLESRLDGNVTSEGQLQDDALPRMSADWNLQGRWQGNNARARGQLASDGREWQVDDLVLIVGENRIEGKGRYGSQLAGDLSILLPEPAMFAEGLAGELEASLQFSGTVDDPTAELVVVGRGLSWQDLLQIEAVDLDASLATGGVLDAALQIDEIRAADQQLENVSLRLEGTRDNELTISKIIERKK